MFPRMNVTTPLPTLPYGVPPYGAGVGFGGINPMVSHMMNPYASSPTVMPLLTQPTVMGQSPYAVQSMLPCPPGQICYPYQQIGAGIGQWCGPFSVAPYPIAQAPCVIPGMSPSIGGVAPTVFGSPVTCVDPVTGAMITQPYPMAQSLLPIRPLINPQACDPVQMAAMSCVMPGMVSDPYSVMAQPGMMPPMAVSPVHQMLRQHIGLPPISVPPIGLSQIGLPQIGVPCLVAPGIPC